MSAAPAITVENLGKRYRLGVREERPQNLRQAITQLAGSPFRYLGSRLRESTDEETLWALRHVSFEVAAGEAVGIMGRNGAGKSTLLKILSRITDPTEGRAVIRGRVNSLLEVGTGFHQELTGRENIYLSAAINGMKRADIDRQFDEIVAFAEIEKFIDTPVKRYSSGMYVRLAFGVAAHLEPDILIIDEVLSVGDASFQNKCLGKMNDATRGGRTVLFVSHNMIAINSLCTRGLLLDDGQIRQEGPAHEVVAAYLRQFTVDHPQQQWEDPASAPGTDLIRVKAVRVLPDGPTSDGFLAMQTPLRVETDYWVLQPNAMTHITYHLVNAEGVIVLTTGSGPSTKEPGLYRSCFKVPGSLLNSGVYSLRIFVVRNANQVAYQREGIASFSIQDAAQRREGYHGREPGAVQPLLAWATERLS